MNELGFSTRDEAAGQSSDRFAIVPRPDFLPAIERQLVEIAAAVVIVAKDCLSVIASTDHVIDRSAVLDPYRSGHALWLTFKG